MSPTLKIKSIASEIMKLLKEIGGMMPLPFETPYAHIGRIRNMQYKSYYNSLYKLQKRGMVKINRDDAGKRFITLTPKGNIKILFSKAKVLKQKTWDGKWRLVIFDIPEKFKKMRDNLRFLLKKNGFQKLQHSVFISPFPFNMEALDYLKATGLIDYIRILRVDALDDDKSLRKKFKLK